MQNSQISQCMAEHGLHMGCTLDKLQNASFRVSILSTQNTSVQQVTIRGIPGGRVWSISMEVSDLKSSFRAKSVTESEKIPEQSQIEKQI